MLLEAGLTAGARSMAPSLGAVYPSTAGKRMDAATGAIKMAAMTLVPGRTAPVEEHRGGGDDDDGDNDDHRKYRAKLPAVATWCKIPQTGSDRSVDRFAPVSGRMHALSPMCGRGIIPERPEPLYPPPASSKPRMPMSAHQPEAADLSTAAVEAAVHQHQRRKGGSVFMNAAPHHLISPRLPVIGMPTSSSTPCSSGDIITSEAAAAAAAAAASVFFQRAFHPAIPGYISPPPPGPPIPGVAQSHPGLHQPPHPGHHPHPHPHSHPHPHPHPPPLPHSHPQHHPTGFPGIPTSAAGFMSLAHILFQPKYAIGKKTFHCHECRYITDRKNNLKRHIATMHQDCGKFLECCDTIFHSKASLRDHVLMFHRTGYKCRFCGRNFCRKALLKRHLTVHNGQKEFICEVCDYATSHKSNLERHRKVHGLGSPIGSDDEEHFLRDGPDDDLYRHFHHEHLHHRDVDEDNPGSGDDSGMMGVMTPEVSDTDRRSHDAGSVRDGEVYIDVESINTNSVTDGEEASVDDVTSVTSNTNVATHIPDEPVTSHTQYMTQSQRAFLPQEAHVSHQSHVPIGADPLLEAFPVTSASGKTSGRKAKGRLYLADRLRQTYDSREPTVRDAESGRPQPGPVEQNPAGGQTLEESEGCDGSEAGARTEATAADSGDSERGSTGRTAAPSSPDGSPSPRSPPARPTPPVGAPGTEQTARVAGDCRRDGGRPAGCKRLYASPYKCSECGKGLSSQRKLLEHSMVCRNHGVEPARPIKPASAGLLPPVSDVSACFSASHCSSKNPDVEDSPQDLSMNNSSSSTTLLNLHNKLGEFANLSHGLSYAPFVTAMCGTFSRLPICRDASPSLNLPEIGEMNAGSCHNFKFSLKRAGAATDGSRATGSWAPLENNNNNDDDNGDDNFSGNNDPTPPKMGKMAGGSREEWGRVAAAGATGIWARDSRQDYSVRRLVAGRAGADAVTAGGGGRAGGVQAETGGGGCRPVAPVGPSAGPDSRTPSPDAQTAGKQLLPIKKRSVVNHHFSA